MASGAGIIALKYRDGVLLATDTLLNYGTMAMYPNVQRIKSVGGHTAIAASGNFADFQCLSGMFDDQLLSDDVEASGPPLGSVELFGWLARVLYARRCRFQPLLLDALVAGTKEGQPFLGFVDSVGTHFEVDDCMATGLAAYIGLPLLRKAAGERPDMSRDEAMEVVENVMSVIFYRNKCTINKIQIADCTTTGVTLSEPIVLPTKWDHHGFNFEHTKLITLPGV
eukprot:TRINITY_DN18499_c0_g1_i1.p1 TRINITY_DN18499_c0_g1~~TRINITY_DN18499_c0_g1_i1.p1  ORF type:complete len:225 (-),score=45.64 TRINITY_DN18499_c0_g1_i1:79-753(-)